MVALWWLPECDCRHAKNVVMTEPPLRPLDLLAADNIPTHRLKCHLWVPTCAASKSHSTMFLNDDMGRMAYCDQFLSQQAIRNGGQNENMTVRSPGDGKSSRILTCGELGQHITYHYIVLDTWCAPQSRKEDRLSFERGTPYVKQTLLSVDLFPLRILSVSCLCHPIKYHFHLVKKTTSIN